VTAVAEAPAVRDAAAPAAREDVLDLMLLDDLMRDLERFMGVTEKHAGRPYTGHLQGIVEACANAVEAIAGLVLPGDDEQPA
jgi:hypothetical protein